MERPILNSMGRSHFKSPKNLLKALIEESIKKYIFEADSDLANDDSYANSTAPIRMGRAPAVAPRSEPFSFETLNSIQDPTQKYNYCVSKLQRLGEGSSREVFKLNDKLVLKLIHPKNPQGGIAQNQGETEKCEPANKIAATVHDHAPDFSWITMDLARKLDENGFQRLTKIDWKTYVSAMAAVFQAKDATDQNKSDYQLASKMPFFNAVVQIAKECNLVIGDLINISNWGIVNGVPKLIDYGFKKHHIGKIVTGPGGEESSG